MSLLRATSVRRAPLPQPASDRVILDHDARLLRRRRLTGEAGTIFVADLETATDLGPGDALVLEDGRLIAIEAAAEPLLEITGDLPRLAWHIGNRHAACQIEPDRLLIRDDPVLRRMLEALGAALRPVTAAFSPEGGAYGHGRVLGHDHGAPDGPVPEPPGGHTAPGDPDGDGDPE